MKMGWGTRIAILYIGFVVLVIIMVVISVRQKIDLVSEDYYSQELTFQNQINSTNNANALTEKVEHTITKEGVEIKFPSLFKGKKVSGEILFFRPSDSSKDLKTVIKLNENEQQFISSSELSKGMYKMQISWKADTTAYYHEDVIVISK